MLQRCEESSSVILQAKQKLTMARCEKGGYVLLTPHGIENAVNQCSTVTGQTLDNFPSKICSDMSIDTTISMLNMILWTAQHNCATRISHSSICSCNRAKSGRKTKQQLWHVLPGVARCCSLETQPQHNSGQPRRFGQAWRLRGKSTCTAPKCCTLLNPVGHFQNALSQHWAHYARKLGLISLQSTVNSTGTWSSRF